VPEVRKEKTGWRDQGISERHRRWGWDCPALDLDFLVLEYDRGKAAALVEFKNEHSAPQFPTHPSYRALIDLGNRAGIPVFGVRYADDWSWWRVTPLNGLAKKHVPKQIRMPEKQWITLLYQIRGTEVPPDLFVDADVEL
jgi:hypothetical protein